MYGRMDIDSTGLHGARTTIVASSCEGDAPPIAGGRRSRGDFHHVRDRTRISRRRNQQLLRISSSARSYPSPNASSRIDLYAEQGHAHMHTCMAKLTKTPMRTRIGWSVGLQPRAFCNDRKAIHAMRVSAICGWEQSSWRSDLADDHIT